MTSLWAAGVLDQLPVLVWGEVNHSTCSGVLLVSAYFRSEKRSKVTPKKCSVYFVIPPFLVIGLSDDPRQTLIPITKSVERRASKSVHHSFLKYVILHCYTKTKKKLHGSGA